MNPTLPPHLIRRLLEAYNEANRKDLKLSQLVNNFFETYKNTIDFLEVQPKEAGDWFYTFILEQPTASEISENKQESAIPIALQIQKMFKEGLAKREIGRRLNISEATVRRTLKIQA